MNEVINSCLTALNSIGRGFCDYAAGIFVQSSVLIVLLLIIDFLLRRRVRAVFRYCVWMLVFVKLILPPTLSLPTGIGYWYGDYLSTDSSVLQQVSNVVRPEPAIAPAPEDFALAAEIAKGLPSQINPETAVPVISAVSGLNALTWQAVVFLLWLVGILVISVLLIQRMLFVKGLIAQSEPAKNRLPDMLNQCRRQVGIGRNIELRLTNNISSPAVCGLFKPVILIPAALLAKLSPDKLRAVLVHELVHIKRADIWVNLVQTVLQIIYFYNPFVWLINAVVRRVREQAVDEMVIVALGAGAKSYSNTLIDIAEMAFWKTSLSLRLIGVVESKKALHRRIKHMLNRPTPKSAKISVFGLLAVMVMAAVLLPMAAAAKDDKEQRSRFIAALPDGVIVELVGVCEHPSEGKQWWRPDGSTIEADGFRDYDFDDAVIPEKNECARLLALKLDDSVLQDVRISWALKDSRESRFAPDYADKKRKRLRPIQVILAALPKEIQSTNLQLRVAAGPWDSVAAGTPGTTIAYARDSINQGAIIYHEAREEKGSIHILATHLMGKDYDCRIVAEDKAGNVHEPRKHSNSGSEMRLCKSVLDIPLETVEWFRLQARPFQWVEFKNVSLKPSYTTDVQIEVEPVRTLRRRYIRNVNRQRHFVMLVVGRDRMTFEGQEVTWKELPAILEKVPDRSQTVLCLAIASEQMMLNQLNEAKGRAARLSRQFGFQYFSYVGIHPLASRGEPYHVIVERQLQFDQEIQIPLEAGTAEESGLVKCQWVKFEKSDDEARAVIRMKLRSWPKVKWEVRILFLDAKAKPLRHITEILESSGRIAGIPEWSERDLEFPLGMWRDVSEASGFQIRIRQLLDTAG